MLSYDEATKTIGGVAGIFDPATKAPLALSDNGAGLTSADLNALNAFVASTYYAVAIRLAPAQRQLIADRWFSMMFTHFKGQPRLAFDSRLTGDADRLCAKLQTSTGQLSFQGMLQEISGFMERFSRNEAERYFNLWDRVINERQPLPRRAVAAS